METEELIVMIIGGEYRRTLKHRGITIVKTYRPASEVIADVAIDLAEILPALIASWNAQIAKAEKKAIRRLNYLIRTGNR